jgi:uncharacterized membrane protein
MKKTFKFFTGSRLIQLAIVAAMFITGFIVYPYLPETIPVHWNFEGQPDNFGPKTIGTFIFPLVSLAIVILFPIFQSIDPKKENYEKFKNAWSAIQLTLITLFAYFYGAQLYFTLNPEQSHLMGTYMTAGVGATFIILGNYISKIRHNYFVGLRTPWTLNDPEVWNKSQRLTGWTFVIGGLALIFSGIGNIFHPYIFFGIIIVMVLLPTVYSFIISKK